MPGADCGSDHIPVVSTMKIKLKKRLKRTKTAQKLQVNMLENDAMMNRYSISVKNKFSALEQLAKSVERWQMFKESMLESAKEHIPVTKRKEDKKKKDEPRNVRPNGREKKSQSRHTEIQKTRQTREKEVQ